MVNRWFLWIVVFINLLKINAEFRKQIYGEVGIIGELVIPPKVEPIDAIESFRLKYGLNKDFRSNLLLSVCQENNVHCHRKVPEVFRNSIMGENNQVLGILSILEDEEPADIVSRFSNSHGLSNFARNQILNSVCQSSNIKCTRSKSLVFSETIVNEDGNKIGVLEIFEGEEPIDSIYKFVQSNKLSKVEQSSILEAACQRLSCTRHIPIIFSTEVRGANNEFLDILHILEGDEPADRVRELGQKHQLSPMEEQSILQGVCESSNIKCNTGRPLLLSSPIVGPDQTQYGNLEIHVGEELADAVYKFGVKNNVSMELRHSLIHQLCGKQDILCTRGNAILYSKPITVGNENIGELTIMDYHEPVDAVYEFSLQHNLTPESMRMLIKRVCEEAELINCTRTTPLVASIPITSENGTQLGLLNLFYEQEAIDAVDAFSKEHSLKDEERASIFNGVCRSMKVRCTRNKPLRFSTKISLPNASDELIPYDVQILDGEEPTDVIYEFSQRFNLSFYDRKNILISLCHQAKEKVNCTRAEPVLFSLPVQETADKLLGTVEIMEGQEPVDVVYSFLEKHELFQTPANTSILEAACNSTRVKCNRMKPRRTLFTMQATYGGIPHSIHYVKPEKDWECDTSDGGSSCIHYVEILSKEFCSLHMPEWTECEKQIKNALRDQLNFYEHQVWKGKDLYAKLGLVKTATLEEIDQAYHELILKYNNETEPKKYEKLRDAYKVLSDPEEKYYYDLPCMKFFGLCGKKKADGSISISAD